MKPMGGVLAQTFEAVINTKKQEEKMPQEVRRTFKRATSKYEGDLEKYF